MALVCQSYGTGVEKRPNYFQGKEFKGVQTPGLTNASNSTTSFEEFNREAKSIWKGLQEVRRECGKKGAPTPGHTKASNTISPEHNFSEDKRGRRKNPPIDLDAYRKFILHTLRDYAEKIARECGLKIPQTPGLTNASNNNLSFEEFNREAESIWKGLQEVSRECGKKGAPTPGRTKASNNTISPERNFSEDKGGHRKNPPIDLDAYRKFILHTLRDYAEKIARECGLKIPQTPGLTNTSNNNLSFEEFNREAESIWTGLEELRRECGKKGAPTPHRTKASNNTVMSRDPSDPWNYPLDTSDDEEMRSMLLRLLRWEAERVMRECGLNSAQFPVLTKASNNTASPDDFDREAESIWIGLEEVRRECGKKGAPTPGRTKASNNTVMSRDPSDPWNYPLDTSDDEEMRSMLLRLLRWKAERVMRECGLNDAQFPVLTKDSNNIASPEDFDREAESIWIELEEVRRECGKKGAPTPGHTKASNNIISPEHYFSEDKRGRRKNPPIDKAALRKLMLRLLRDYAENIIRECGLKVPQTPGHTKAGTSKYAVEFDQDTHFKIEELSTGLSQANDFLENKLNEMFPGYNDKYC